MCCACSTNLTYSLINSIPTEWIQIIKKNVTNKENYQIGEDIQDITKMKTKNIYRCFIDFHFICPVAQVRWKDELTDGESIEWETIWLRKVKNLNNFKIKF